MTSDPTQPGGRQPDLLGPEEDADIPPPPHGLAADPIDGDAQARLQRMSRRGRLLPVVLVLAAIGAFIGLVWWAYQAANRPETPAELPVVEAEPGDPKVRPESEGGMTVPNQDKLIYQELGQAGGQDAGEPTVERLLPPPEEPLDPPAPPAPEPAQTAADTAGLTPPPPPQEISPTLQPAEEGQPEPAETPPAQAAETPAPTGDAATEQQAGAEQAAEPAPAPEQAPVPEAEPEQQAAAPATPPEEPEAPAPAAAGTGFRVQLAALKSEADARQAWARLQKAHADLLGGLQPTIQRADLGDQGVFYRVQAGALPSREAAAALCDQLKAKDQACLVVKP